MVSNEQRIEFITKIAPLVLEVCRNRGYGNIQAYTCICQACCETGYGTSALMMKANALFGIKATASWLKNGKYGTRVFRAKTKECYDGKTLTTIQDAFRAYDSILDSIEDYFDLMELKRYCNSLNVNTSVHDCITIIKNGGYATSPKYIDTVSDIFKLNESTITKYRVGIRCPYCGKEIYG